ncbi:SRPBCC domain-containing protein [Nocardia sp. NBC_01503]|uniref:SRPBCC domain-containing protein n=1 Tax=Nocardia sp. NBC_01503 TaxID=2975997 RepID=UPI002E7C3E0B|nr:SRPBCC domain-containing protein [Nocardia sp. NBC_01503]WTL32453.1 SRPBCC domain-containing protein [Nocardia sp. NBC_01503]
MNSTRVEWFVSAPRPNVFRALLDARSVRTWMVPDGMTSRIHEFDPRVGGRFRISLSYDIPTAAGKTSAHTDTFHGHFVRLVPDTEVVQSVEFETENPELCGEMTITYLLQSERGGTRVIARHENLPPGLSPDDNEIGFRMSLAKLADLAEREEADAPPS